jgi:hypothetical protein
MTLSCHGPGERLSTPPVQPSYYSDRYWQLPGRTAKRGRPAAVKRDLPVMASAILMMGREMNRGQAGDEMP